MYPRSARLAVSVLLLSAGCGSPSAPAGPGSPSASPGIPVDAAAPSTPPGNDAGAVVVPPGDARVPADAPILPADAAPPPETGAPGVRFIARVDRTDPARPKFAWSGSTILARFTGSSIGVRLAGAANYFDVRIDGTLQPTVLATAANKQDYPLATGLPAGPHELSVFRRTEARQGETTFLGLILDPAGALLPPPPPGNRRLEIIGDSTTCGYGDEGKSAGCPFTPATENYDVAYGAVAARALGAELITVAWSAKGMYRNFQGDMTDTLPTLYGRSLGVQPSSAWDPGAWIPDAVLINLGDNDFQQGDPGQPFVTTYTAFVHRLRGYYPNALIVCAVGPKLSGSHLAGARQYVMGIVSALKSAGDDRVDFLELPQAGPGDGSGCGGHASIATHKRMADTLVAALKPRLGW
jgi:lysophospholipase L1-like esterase